MHIDQELLIKIISGSPANGHLECIGWEPEHWINLDGHAHHYTYFEQVSPTIYVDELLMDTVKEVDEIIENMMKYDPNVITINLRLENKKKGNGKGDSK